MVFQMQDSLAEAFKDLAKRWRDHPDARMPCSTDPELEERNRRMQGLFDNRFDTMTPSEADVCETEGNLALPYELAFASLAKEAYSLLSLGPTRSDYPVKCSVESNMNPTRDTVLISLQVDGSCAVDNHSDSETYQEKAFALPEVSILGHWKQRCPQGDGSGEGGQWEWRKLEEAQTAQEAMSSVGS